jgi:hypothetical protein
MRRVLPRGSIVIANKEGQQPWKGQRGDMMRAGISKVVALNNSRAYYLNLSLVLI